MSGIDSVDAKKELGRIDRIVSENHLLIGGLAVKYYHPPRESKDIDLVCNDSVRNTIIRELFTTDEWSIRDVNDDELRPEYHIKNKQDGFIISFGPKIEERVPYKDINWRLILNDHSIPYRNNNIVFDKIHIPNAAALAYTKLISFVNRQNNKAKQDLQDFIDVTNHKDCSIDVLFNFIIRVSDIKKLETDFWKKIHSTEEYTSITIKGNIFKFANFFSLNPPQPHFIISSPLPTETSPQKLVAISQQVNALISDLKETIWSHRLPGTFLFQSNAATGDASITVSSIVLCAFHTIGARETQVVCDAILEERIQDNSSDNGAWYGETGEHCHVMVTAWALFACLQARCTLITELDDSINWLINAQWPSNPSDVQSLDKLHHRGGWGIAKGKTAHTFYTAFAINALIEAWHAYKVMNKQIPTKLMDAVRGGVEFLHRVCWSSGQPRTYLWEHFRGTEDFCIASTAMAVHVLAKYHNLTENSAQSQDLHHTVKALCDFMRNGPPEYDMIIVVDGKEIKLTGWPQFRENDPNYWYLYFTPILIITLLHTAQDVGWNSFPAAKDAIVESVQWIIKNQNRRDSGVFISMMSHRINPEALWPSAQSIIVLRRWQEALSELLLNVFLSDK